MRHLALIVLALACALSFAATASAREPIETVVQDDALLLHRGDDEVAATMDRLRGLGVDRVRLTAGWSVIAPEPDATLAPGFDAGDPEAYPRANWRNLDRAVRLAHHAGLEIMIDIAFWAPAWATSHAPPEGRARENIDAAAYSAFARAVVRRYSGSFVPTFDRGEPPPPSKDRELLDSRLGSLPVEPPTIGLAGDPGPLPKVRLWTIWNEPNLNDFFLPQYERTPAGLVPVSPHLYRTMIEATYPQIKAIQPDSTVLVGGTAAIGGRTPGSENSSMPPLRFLRHLACVDDSFVPITTGRCAAFRQVQGDGFSHHPYSLSNTPSFTDPRNPDRVPIGALDRLAATLDRLVGQGRIAAGLRDVYLTEFGYASNPPDPRARYGLEQQARLINRAEYKAWSNPRVRSWPQFLLRDSSEQSLYQTGLLFADGRPKPAAQSFEFALVADCANAATTRRPRRRARRRGARPGRRPPGRARRSRRSRDVLIWGHVRPGSSPQRVTLSVLRGGRWRPLADDAGRRRPRSRRTRRGPGGRALPMAFTTGADGVFLKRVRFERGARFRAEAVAPGGTVRRSLEVVPGGCGKPAI